MPGTKPERHRPWQLFRRTAGGEDTQGIAAVTDKADRNRHRTVSRVRERWHSIRTCSVNQPEGLQKS